MELVDSGKLALHVRVVGFRNSEQAHGTLLLGSERLDGCLASHDLLVERSGGAMFASQLG